MFNSGLMFIPNDLTRQAEVALREWTDPVSGRDLFSTGAIVKLEAFTFRLYLDVDPGFWRDCYGWQWRDELESFLLANTQAKFVSIGRAEKGLSG